MRLWQARPYGIAALKNVMDFFGAETPSMDKLIMIGLSMDAYDPKHGWSYQGFANIAIRYGLRAATYNWSREEPDSAFCKLKRAAKFIPCLTSIHNNFGPQNSSHLMIITQIARGRVFYRRPSTKRQGETVRAIKIDSFLKKWTRHGVIIRR